MPMPLSSRASGTDIVLELNIGPLTRTTTATTTTTAAAYTTAAATTTTAAAHITATTTAGPTVPTPAAPPSPPTPAGYAGHPHLLHRIDNACTMTDQQTVHWRSRCAGRTREADSCSECNRNQGRAHTRVSSAHGYVRAPENSAEES